MNKKLEGQKNEEKREINKKVKKQVKRNNFDSISGNNNSTINIGSSSYKFDYRR